jgi:hypothetical protein
MSSVAFQFALVVSLVCAIVHVRLSLQRQRSRKWEEILARRARADGLLFHLSCGSIFSGDLEVPIEDVWKTMGQTYGLRAIYGNTGILIEAVEYIGRTVNPSPPFVRTIEQISIESRRIRLWAIMLLIQKLLLLPERRVSSRAAELARAYLQMVADISLLISDYCPDRIKQYQQFIVQT